MEDIEKELEVKAMMQEAQVHTSRSLQPLSPPEFFATTARLGVVARVITISTAFDLLIWCGF